MLIGPLQHVRSILEVNSTWKNIETRGRPINRLLSGAFPKKGTAPQVFLRHVRTISATMAPEIPGYTRVAKFDWLTGPLARSHGCRYWMSTSLGLCWTRSCRPTRSQRDWPDCGTISPGLYSWAASRSYKEAAVTKTGGQPAAVPYRRESLTYSGEWLDQARIVVVDVPHPHAHGPTGHPVEGYGESTAFSSRVSAGFSPSHVGHLSDHRTTGIRSRSSVQSSFGVVVTMA
jgi:hypothetical protein